MTSNLDLIWIGQTWKNCGDSAGQKSALNSDQSFQSQAGQNYQTTFGQNQTLFKNLTAGLNAITGAGPGQQGYTAPELAAMNSQNINAAAASNQKIQTAIGENAASVKGGSGAPGVESGIEQAERAQAATAVDTSMNNNAANITQQNYATGRQNYWNATKATEEAPAAFEDPTSQAGNVVNSSNQVTGAQANANEQSSTGTELLGLGEGLAADAATAIGGKKGCWVAAAVYGGWEDPRVNAARNYIFNIWAKKSVAGLLVSKLYLAIGEKVAAVINRFPAFKKVFKPLFDIAVRKNSNL